MSHSPFVRSFSLHSQVADSPGGAGPDPGSSSSPATSSSSTGSSSPAGPGTGNAAPPAETRPAFTYAEDRSKWIPQHRFNEVARRQQELEQRYETQQAKVRALMGIDAPENPQQAQLRNAMKEMFPGLSKLIDDPKMAERLTELLGQQKEASGFQDAYWTRHATEQVTTAVEEYAKAAGIQVSDLPPNRVAAMARQLQSFISADPSGQRRNAYERRDPAFIPSFIADLTGVFVAPLRKQATVATANQIGRVQSLPSTRGPATMPGATTTGAAPLKGKALHEAARRALLSATGN